MSTLPFTTAASIAGYTLANCMDCRGEYWKAPWFIPCGNRCEACRSGVIEHFKEESRDDGRLEETEESDE